MKEQRRFERLDINVTVKWSKGAKKPQNLSVYEDTSKNISGGGICLMIYEKVEVGDCLNLEIMLPTGKTIRTSGRVAWLKEFEIASREDGMKGYDVGLEFVDIADEDKKEIKKFVLNPYPHS